MEKWIPRKFYSRLKGVYFIHSRHQHDQYLYSTEASENMKRKEEVEEEEEAIALEDTALYCLHKLLAITSQASIAPWSFAAPQPMSPPVLACDLHFANVSSFHVTRIHRNIAHNRIIHTTSITSQPNI
jgi:hypothetical protein